MHPFWINQSYWCQTFALIAFLVISHRILIVSCALIYDDAIRACAVSTVTADSTGKFVLLRYSLTASHCSTEAHLAGVPFPRSFDSRLVLRQNCSARLKSLIGCGCKNNTPVPRLNKGISCQEKGDKNCSFEQGGHGHHWPPPGSATAARMKQVITTLWSHTSKVEEWNRQIIVI